MKFFLWLVAYSISLVIQISVLSQIIGPVAPTISFAVLLFGLSFQSLWASLWFAGIAGILRDSIAPAPTAMHTIFFIATVLVIHFFKNLSNWDEPIRTIASVGVGLVALPFTWFIAVHIGEAIFHLSAIPFSWRDIVSTPGRTEIIFSIIWFFAFAWVSIRYFRVAHSALSSRL